MLTGGVFAGMVEVLLSLIAQQQHTYRTSTQLNTSGRFWTIVLDSTIETPADGRSFGRTSSIPSVHDISRPVLRVCAKVAVCRWLVVTFRRHFLVFSSWFSCSCLYVAGLARLMSLLRMPVCSADPRVHRVTVSFTESMDVMSVGALHPRGHVKVPFPIIFHFL